MHNEHIFEICVWFFFLMAILEMSVAFRKEWFKQKIQEPT